MSAPCEAMVVFRAKGVDFSKQGQKGDETKVLCSALELQRKNGKLIEYTKQDETIFRLGPAWGESQSTDVKFPTNLSYPYYFTMVAANMSHGKEGEGVFLISIYSKDKQMSIRRMN